MKYEGYAIEIEFLAGNFGDMETDVEEYVDMLEEKLLERFPGADVVITYQKGFEGAGGHTYITVPDSVPELEQLVEEEYISTVIDDIEEEVFADLCRG